MKFKSNVELEALSNAATDTDRFIVSDSNTLKYRTGSQVLSDIGGQASLTNPVTGTGTLNFVSKFTSTGSTLGNSVIYDNGTNVGIGTTSPATEANLSLGAKSTTEGGHLALFKGTSQTYATHIDNYGNSLRIMSGTDASTTAVQFLLNHSSGAIQFNSYNSTNQTGTPTYLLGTDALGNIVKTNTVPGSAAGPYLPLAGGTMSGALNILIPGDPKLILQSTSGDTSDWNYINFVGRDAVRDGFVGTDADGDMQVYSDKNSSSVQLTASGIVLNGGNVGIGTVSPTYRLDITGNDNMFRLKDANGLTVVDINGDAGAPATLLKFGDLDGAADNVKFTIDTQIGNFLFENGNVGIGTTSPTATLDVNGAGNFSGGTVVSGIDTSTNVGVAIARGDYLYSNDGSYLRNIIGHSSTGSIDIGHPGTGLITDIKFFPGSSGNILFYASGSENMRVASSGNVGIGTTSPNNKLSVAGNIQATNNGVDISDNSDWPTNIIIGNSVYPAYIKAHRYTGSYSNGLDFYYSDASSGNSTLGIRLNSGGNVGIGTAIPKAKLDVNGRFCVDSKTHNLTNAFTTCLTVNLSSHTGCYVTLTCFGDWGSHSAAAYRGEFFLQNGANAYAEPGIILRQDDNTSNGADQIVCQILDPTGTGNPKDFEIQIRTTATTGTTSFTGQLTYTVQGQFNSIT
jgi:hypothetical protein